MIAPTTQSGTHGLSAFVIEQDDAGLSFGAGQVEVDWNARPTGQVVLDGVRVAADRRLGAEGDGFRVATSAVNGGRLHLAACSLGGAKAALNRSFAQLGGRPTTAGTLLLVAAVQLQLADERDVWKYRRPARERELGECRRRAQPQVRPALSVVTSTGAGRCWMARVKNRRAAAVSHCSDSSTSMT